MEIAVIAKNRVLVTSLGAIQIHGNAASKETQCKADQTQTLKFHEHCSIEVSTSLLMPMYMSL